MDKIVEVESHRSLHRLLKIVYRFDARLGIAVPSWMDWSSGSFQSYGHKHDGESSEGANLAPSTP